jgi:hypothetical protein
MKEQGHERLTYDLFNFGFSAVSVTRISETSMIGWRALTCRRRKWKSTWSVSLDVLTISRT